MAQITFSSQLVNGTLCDASAVMDLLNELKDGANALDDANISSLTESGASITMDSSGGHTHDGADATLLAFAEDGASQGAVKVATSTFTTDNPGGSGWSSNQNTGADAIETIMGATLLWRSSTTGVDHYIQNNVGLVGSTDGYSGRYVGMRGNTYDYLHIFIDDTVTPNGVYVFVGGEDGDSGNGIHIKVMMVGVG